MEVLLTGNTGYITEKFVESAFPDCHVVVNGACSINKDQKNIRLVHSSDLEQEKDMLDVYEFDQIVFFSYYLTCHGTQTGEMEDLRRILQYCRGRKTQLVYLAGPAVTFTEKTGKSVLAASAEELCQHYMNTSGVQVKIVHLPFLYSTTYRDDFICHLFESADHKHEVVFREPKQQCAFFLSTTDLADLLFRIFDSWDIDHDTITVPDVFAITFEQLGTEIQKLFPGTKIIYTDEYEIEDFPQDDKIIRQEYGWFPKISILTDMQQLYENYFAYRKPKERMFDKVERWLKKHGKLWKFIELLVFFAVAEVLNYFAGNSAQFRFIDIRLLYIVIIATIYGMDMGVLAAALASLSLVVAYASDGIGWITLFYEPTNWMPFILYFLVGAICGYVQMKNQNSISFFKKENAILREKFIFVKSLYQDASQEKRDLKRQILGSKDSFGKIFDITRKLDSVRPQEIFVKTLRIMEEILENHSVQIYSFGTNQAFARLETASREIADTVPRSLKIEDYSLALETINEGNIWVNQNFYPNYPMYMVGIKRDERLVLLVMIQTAKYSQMNLYYQNLIKILCGLVETALLRAINYQEALYDEQHFNHSIFMKESYFIEKLNFYRSMQDDKIADYTLVRLNRFNMSLEEAEDILKFKTRENDTIGICGNQDLYLILHQTSPAQAGIAIKRLEAAGFGCEIISLDGRDGD